MNFEIRAYRNPDRDGVVSLWIACGLVKPWNDPYIDIARKLAVQPEMFLVAAADGGDGEIIATVMAGYEGHRGWLNYLAVHPDHQHVGVGRKITGAAEKLLMKAGCPKINLQVRSSNSSVIEFYRKLGYMPDEVVSLGKRLVNDN